MQLGVLAVGDYVFFSQLQCSSTRHIGCSVSPSVKNCGNISGNEVLRRVLV